MWLSYCYEFCVFLSMGHGVYLLQIRTFRRCVVLPVFSRRVSHWIGISVLRQSSIVPSYITLTFPLLFFSGIAQSGPTGCWIWLQDIPICFTCVWGASTKQRVQQTTLSPRVSNWFVSSRIKCKCFHIWKSMHHVQAKNNNYGMYGSTDCCKSQLQKWSLYSETPERILMIPNI